MSKDVSTTMMIECGYKLEIDESVYIKFINQENVIIDFKLHNNNWITYKYKELEDRTENIKLTLNELFAIADFCEIRGLH